MKAILGTMNGPLIIKLWRGTKSGGEQGKHFEICIQLISLRKKNVDNLQA